MMLKAINKAMADGMKMPEVEEVLRKCGYHLTISATEVCETTLEIMTGDPPDPNEICPGSAEPLTFFSSSTTIDGADFFDMATRGVGIYRRATIRKLWNPNFISAMSKLGSPLENRR